MRKYSWILAVILIGCIVAFASCRRMERMIAPALPDAEQVEPPEMPEEMMPMAEEGIGIFDTDVMPGHGLIAEAFYPGVTLEQLPDFDTLTPFHTWMVANIDVPHTPYERGFPQLGVDVLEDFGIRLRGQLKVDTAGDYNFKVQSDDGAQVYINDELIVDNDGLNAFTTAIGSAMLTAGYHDLEIRYFQGPRTHIGLQWSWQPPGEAEAIVPPEVLYPPGTGEVAAEPMMEMEMPIAEMPLGMPTLDKIYWTQTNGVIRRANPDGSNVEDVVTGLGYASGIAIDSIAGKVYWVDHALNGIQRANLDGTGIENLVSAADTQSPALFALDVSAGKMYWTGWTMNSVRRANLDGSNVEDYITGLSTPSAVLLDVPGNKIYWTSGPIGGDSSFYGANLNDLSDSEKLADISGVFHLTLHPAQQKIFWTERYNSIRCANLDGSNIQDLVDGLGQPGGIEVDIHGGKMYWRDWSTDKIQRANLDGSNVEDVVTGVPADVISFLYTF